MARVTDAQHSFSRGTVTPRVHGRLDTQLYYAALEDGENYIVDGLGTLERRPGTKLAGRTKNDGEAHLHPFVYDIDQSYVLEFGSLYMRAWFDGGLVLDGGLPSEIVTPYTVDEAEHLSYTQLQDVMWVASGTKPLKTIKRTTASTFAIADFELLDGPYLDTDPQGTTIKPSDYGSITPTMTSNTTPSPNVVSGTAINLGDHYRLFDRDNSTYAQYTTFPADVVFDLGAGNARVVDGYYIRAYAGSSGPNRAPTSFKLQGRNGSGWVTLDSQSGETGWSGGETRFFNFENSTAYQEYRLRMESSGDSVAIIVGELGLHERAENQTPFLLTFSATAGINDGAGFTSDDVDRLLRFRGNDGRWRWCRIAQVDSTTEVRVRLYDQALPERASITTWRLGVFTASTHPSIVTFHENRLTLTSRNKAFLSQGDAYNKFSPTDPDGTVNPDNAITVNIPAVNAKKGAVSDIVWAQSQGAQLVLGTPSGIHTIQSSSFGEPLTPDTVTRHPQDSRGASRDEPSVVGDSVVYTHSGRRKLMGTYARDRIDKLGAQDLSLPAGHLTGPKIRGVTWQEEPHSLTWGWMDDGSVATLTVQPEEKVQAWNPQSLGGVSIDSGVNRHAAVESMATIPSPDGGDDRVHMIVRRTIDGQTRRFVEVMQPFRQLKEDVRDSWFVDCGLRYEGNADVAKSIDFTGTGIDDRTGTTNFTTPLFTAGSTLVWHDGVRWHHGRITAVGTPSGGSYTFTWQPTKPNARPGPADGRWHYVDGSWVQHTVGERINVYVPTYVEPANQTGITRWSQAITQISGLDDFEGQALDLVIDGAPSRGHTVEVGGTISNLPPCHIVLAGFGYESRGKALPVEAGSQKGSSIKTQRPVYEVVIDVLESRWLEAGTGLPSSYDGAWEQFDPVTFPDSDIVLQGEPLPLHTGPLRVSRDEQGEIDNPSVAWRQVEPMPSTIRGIYRRLSQSDGR